MVNLQMEMVCYKMPGIGQTKRSNPRTLAEIAKCPQTGDPTRPVVQRRSIVRDQDGVQNAETLLRNFSSVKTLGKWIIFRWIKKTAIQNLPLLSTFCLIKKQNTVRKLAAQANRHSKERTLLLEVTNMGQIRILTHFWMFPETISCSVPPVLQQL